MKTVQLNTRIDPTLKRALEVHCRTHGIAMSHFVQEALLDRLEELDDIEELKTLRHEPTRRFDDVLSDLGLDGEV